ncbi:MAG: glutathione S-transferase family protein [Solirubrobacteraceae bacterium]
MKVKLYMFTGSNAVLTAQLMLAHKGIEYKRVNLPPAAHAFIVLVFRFKAMTVPALKIDGRRVQGTRYIARVLDEVAPGRPLFPADPERRLAVEEAERWGEEFQNAIRRIVYSMARRNRTAYKNVILAERSFLMRAILRLALPLIVYLATAKHGATDDAAKEDVALLPARLDRIDAWIEQGVLDGPELNAADFQIAPNLAAMLMSEDGAPYVIGRPVEQLARRVAPDYSGSVGAALPAGTIPKALPSEWLPPLPGGKAA